MSKKEFMNELEFFLSDVPKNEREEILYDYEEHFRVGKENRKTDEDLIMGLGNPKDIAEQYGASAENKTYKYKEPKGREILSLILIAIALLFLSIILIGPYVGVLGGLIGLCAAAISIVIAGIAMVLSPILSIIFPQISEISSGFSIIVLVLAGIGTIALGLVACIGMFYAMKWFGKLLLMYSKWVVRMVKGGRE